MNSAQCSASAPLASSSGCCRASAPTLAARVAAAFHAALDDGATSDELRVSTNAFVGTLKADGLSPEKALVALKDILMQGGRCVSLAPVCCTNHKAAEFDQRIYSQVFGWYLDAYYREGEPSTGPTGR
jgi:hypothetical protein